MSVFKKFIRRSIIKLLPKLSEPLLRFSHARHIAHLERRLGLHELNQRMAKRTGGRVVAGPFAGMPYVDRATGSLYCPKLIGSYEVEIRPWIERAIAFEYDVFVDVGCAEGYYAVGFARASPKTKVFAYDTDPRARRLTAELALLNNVADRVDILSRCTPASFAELPAGCTLILSDCEGFEEELLDPQISPRLCSVDILVETHEAQSPGIIHLILERFSSSHRIERVEILKRDPADYPIVHGMSTEEIALALNELRTSHQVWLMLTAIGPI